MIFSDTLLVIAANYTDPHDRIVSYSLYWCLTLLEYLLYTPGNISI